MKQNSNLLKSLGTLLLLVLFALQANAQNLTVTGTVTDKFGPVIGASIVVEGTTNGCITDIDGNYTLHDVPAKGILTFSYIGYVTQSIPVAGKTKIDVTMAEDSQMLQEVVVVGYGVQRKSDLTGAVASVKAAEVMKNTPTSNVSDALQGRMAGVSVAGGGDPSQGSNIRIRGVNSVSGDAGPLVVIDGFIGGNLKNINPSDIQSIEVLKDASATAVYGSRGANGVILVTTKSPDKDKTTIEFNAFVNIKTILDKPDMLSAGEFADLANDFKKEYYTKPDQQAPLYNAEQVAAYKNGTAGFNYIDHIFNEPAIAQNYDLSISGKNGKTSYLASFRYEDTQGILKESKYKQYNWRLKLDTELKKWMKVGLNLWGDYSENSGPRMAQYNGLLLSAINFAPTVEPRDENGNLNNKFAINGNPAYNPMGHIEAIRTQNQRINNHLQGYVQFNILDGLTFRSQIGITFDNRLRTETHDEDSYNYLANSYTEAKAKSDWNFSFLNTNTLNYTKEFNANHRVNATAVFEQAHSNEYWHNTIAQQLHFANKMGSNSLAYADRNLGESDRQKASLLSAMLRLNYVLMNRYMFTASFRADGSSRLADKWDYFPSFALAWNVKEEAFMKDVDWMDQFKVRLGYGSVGNQAVEIYRIYSQMVPVKNPDGTTSYAIGRPAARDLKWERNIQINAGLDFSFLNGRITTSIDYYNKLSKDILLEVAQPAHTGWTSLLRNAGEIRNSGIELTIGATPYSSKNWNWRSDLTLSHNNGKYEKIPTLDGKQNMGDKFEKKVFKMIEGEKLGTFWGYTYEGVWKTADVNAIAVNAKGEPILNKNGEQQTNGECYKVVPGQAKYKDANGDGVYNESDQGIIGCGQPMFNWGWTNTVSYKNFDLSLFITGFHGFDIYNATHQSRFGSLPGCTTDLITPNPEFLNRWTPENEDTDIPGFVQVGKGDIREALSTRFVENGSFVKIKSITLGYNLPENICQNLGINNFRVYGSVQNPFHISGYSGLDPEAALGNSLTQGVDWGAYPNGRNFIFGINLSF